MKVAHLVIAGLFAVFAVLQYNDPDPLLWILIYGSVAIVAVLKIYLRQVNFGPLIMTLLIIYLLYALTYVPDFIDFLSSDDKSELVGAMKVTKPWIEGTREMLGLFIAMGALLYLKNSKKPKR